MTAERKVIKNLAQFLIFTASFLHLPCQKSRVRFKQISGSGKKVGIHEKEEEKRLGNSWLLGMLVCFIKKCVTVFVCVCNEIDRKRKKRVQFYEFVFILHRVYNLHLEWGNASQMLLFKWAIWRFLPWQKWPWDQFKLQCNKQVAIEFFLENACQRFSQEPDFPDFPNFNSISNTNFALVILV